MRSIKSFDYAPNSHKAKDWQRAVTKNLAVLDQVCREHGIRYSLCFGGLLGAVRHRGIIPWDNDVDVVMFEEDYLKLQKLALEGKLPEGYAVVDRATEEGYPLLFGRFVDTRTSCPLSTSAFNGGTHGLFVDLFVLYPLADNAQEREDQVTDFLVWEELLCWVKRRSGYRTPAFAKRWQEIKAIEKQQGRDIALRTIEASFRSRMPERGEWCFHSSGGAYNGYPRFKTEWFERTEYAPFEDIELAVPVQAREVLQQFYGSSWRTFPEGEKFTPYAASSINIPGPVITHDYMQLIDQDECNRTFRDWKNVLMDELVVRCEVSPVLIGAEAQLAADDFNKCYAKAKPAARKLATPEAAADRAARAAFSELDDLGRDLVALQKRDHFKSGHVAVPVDPDLMTAALWQCFLTKGDYWNVEKVISLQTEGGARNSFADSAANQALEKALAATRALYFCIDRHDVEGARAHASVLNDLCPDGIQTAVAWSFIAAQTAVDHPEDAAGRAAALETVLSYRACFANDDYLKYFAAQLLAESGKTKEAEILFDELAQHSVNGVILLEASDYCEAHGLPFAHRTLTGAKPAAGGKPSPFAKGQTPTAKDFLKHGAVGLKAGRTVMASGALAKSKELEPLSAKAKELESRVERYRALRRVTDRRFNAWELVYPRKEALLEAAAAGQLEEVRRYAKPYFDAVYRLFDRSHLGVFIDEEVYEACKPLFVQERGPEFLAEYEAVVPAPHRGNISDLLRQAGVNHPSL